MRKSYVQKKKNSDAFANTSLIKLIIKLHIYIYIYTYINIFINIFIYTFINICVHRNGYLYF